MSNVIVGAKVNLDSTPLFADNLGVEIASKGLLFAQRAQGVYQGYPYYKINVSLNGTAYSWNCTQEVYDALGNVPPATPLSRVVLGVDMRYKKFKIVDVAL